MRYFIATTTLFTLLGACASSGSQAPATKSSSVDTSSVAKASHEKPAEESSTDSEAPALPETKNIAVENRTAVTDFSLEDTKGKMVSLSGQKGKVVVITFWATWCKPCLQELPHLNKFYKKHKDDGLTILAINTDGPDTYAQAQTIIKRKRLKMPILKDPQGEVAAILNPRGTNPYTLFIDRFGRLAADHQGFAKGDEIKALAKITKLLAEPGPS